MKILVRKALVFALVLGLCCALFHQINQRLFQTISPVIDPKVELVSCGSSLTQYALSDSIIPGFQNLSHEGKTGLETYKTVQEVIDNNPHLESVIIDFTVMGMIEYRDYSYFIPIFAQKQFENTYPLVGFEDLRAYPLNPKYYFLNQVRNEWVPNIDYLKKWWSRHEGSIDTDFPYLGSYQPKQGSRNNWNPKAWLEKAEMLRKLTGSKYPVSTIDVSYMDSIAAYTQSKGVNLIIFLTPLHQDIIPIVPQIYWDEFYALFARAEEYDHVRMIDFTTFPLADSAFINFTHINENGAMVISHAFRDSLLNHQLLPEEKIIRNKNGAHGI